MIKTKVIYGDWATKQGLTLKKSRAQTYNMDDQGGYMVIDTNTNAIVYGEKFDLSLEDVEKYLKIESSFDLKDMESAIFSSAIALSDSFKL